MNLYELLTAGIEQLQLHTLTLTPAPPGLSRSTPHLGRHSNVNIGCFWGHSSTNPVVVVSEKGSGAVVVLPGRGVLTTSPAR